MENTIGLAFEDLVDLAFQMETNGAAYYGKAAARSTDPNLRRVFTDLQGMEEEHARVWAGVKTQLDASEPIAGGVEAVVAEYLGTWLSGIAFDRTPEDAAAIAEGGSVPEIFRVAIGLEKETIAFYTGLRTVVADDRVLERLDWMTKEELKHVVELSKTLRGLTEI
jgi:rubrerythrin